MLAWLSVWSEVQTCIWPSWCHCHSLYLASVKSRLVLPFWYRLTRVVPEKRQLNGCVLYLSTCVYAVDRLLRIFGQLGRVLQLIMIKVLVVVIRWWGVAEADRAWSCRIRHRHPVASRNPRVSDNETILDSSFRHFAPGAQFAAAKRDVKGKSSPCSTAERRVPELIPFLGSQVTWVTNPAVGSHYFPPGLQLPPESLRGLLPVLLLGEQRHDGCEQFA